MSFEQGNSDDEFADVDWEQADPSFDVETPIELNIQHSPDGNIVISDQNSSNPKKRIRKRDPKFTDLDFEQSLKISQGDLTLIFEKLKSNIIAAHNEELAAFIQSFVPINIIASVGNSVDSLISLVDWFSQTFKLIPPLDLTEDEGSIGSHQEELIVSCLQNLAGSPIQLYQVFYSLLNSLGYFVRLVFSVDYLSLIPCSESDSQPSSNKKRKSLSSSERSSRVQCWVEILFNPLKKELLIENKQEKSLHNSSISSYNTWIPLDFILKSINRNDLVESKLRKGKPIQLAISLQIFESKYVVFSDVTSKYSSASNHSLPKKLLETESKFREWVSRFIVYSSDKIPQSTVISLLEDEPLIEEVDNSNNQILQEASRLETDLLKQYTREAQMKIPKSFKEFKDHPLYLLQRYLKADETILPESKPIGIFKGENIFLMKDKANLLSKMQWRKLGKMIKPDETPLKMQTRSVKATSSSLDTNGNTSFRQIEIPLYGPWQTIAYDPGEVIDGIIPRNQYGNIEIWSNDDRYVPRGCCFIEHRLAVKASRFLGLEFVPAVTSFEQGYNGPVPRITGVVILEGQRQFLLDAIFQLEGIKNEKDFEEMDRKIAAKWSKLTRTLLIHTRLKSKYGIE